MNLTHFRTTVVAADGFFDTFQRIADVALSSRGRMKLLDNLFCFGFFPLFPVALISNNSLFEFQTVVVKQILELRQY